MKTIGEQLFDIFQFMDMSDKKGDNSIDSFVKQVAEMWNNINDNKYNVENSNIIIVRMINEFADLKNTEEVEKWLHELDRMIPQSPEYAVDFFKGKTYYKVQQYDKACEYLKKAYKENQSFFNKYGQDEGQGFLDFVKNNKITTAD